MGKIAHFDRLELTAPEPLASHHILSHFDSGRSELDEWVRHRARPSEGLSARTYVTCKAERPDIVVGYHCLSAGAIERQLLPTAKLRRNMPEFIPVSILGRLAADRSVQGRGVGSGLLKDAILRSLQMASIVGCRFIVVQPIDGAEKFYARYGFNLVGSSAGPWVLSLAVAQTAIDGIEPGGSGSS